MNATTFVSPRCRAARYHESTVTDYFRLLKPGVMSLVVFTGWVGMVLAPGHIHPFLGLLAIFCIALGCGASGAINMWYDRDIDAVMHRTRNRPIPAGRVPAEEALHFGVGMAFASVALMGLAANWAAAACLAAAILFYVGVYTFWLKRSTPQNIVIGGAAGAFPPVIGWAAVTGSVALFPLVLFLIIFLWTPPHFWALALYRNEDYRRANVPMMPVMRGLPHTKRLMLAYTCVLLPMTLVPAALGWTGFFYASAALCLGARFVQHALRVLRSEDDTPARRMFAFSILYLFALFGALVVDECLRRYGVGEFAF